MSKKKDVILFDVLIVLYMIYHIYSFGWDYFFIGMHLLGMVLINGLILKFDDKYVIGSVSVIILYGISFIYDYITKQSIDCYWLFLIVVVIVSSFVFKKYSQD
ncbi:hypothetical protein [uncultured Thomasclavelia sp.]|uniref:hypothetical protein n=1 Tax=uncultured Thomasclavelia sp. TaxID=3025759 RepID=UPI0025D2C719|nr:hypothetical protein [uncultured Thomasclavelia sp.]